MKRTIILAAAVAFGQAGAVAAQEPGPGCSSSRVLAWNPVPGPARDLARLAEISGRAEAQPRMVRRWSSEPALLICGETPWAESVPATPSDSGLAYQLLPVRASAGSNSGYVRDRNNGATWGGRGVNLGVTGGVFGRYGPFSAAFHPEVIYQENADFIESARRDLSGIDWPQRPGNTSFASVEPGQSFIRVDAYGAAAGASTENVWLGPGLSTSLLMGGTAPGFPHLFAGTSEPVDVGFATIEAQMLWGELSESTLFDDDATNDERLLTALLLNVEPGAIPGLYLGAARVFYRYMPDDGIGLGDAFPFFGGFTRSAVQASRDQRDEFVALYMRWVLPSSGFEVWGEWARYDANADLHDFIVEPDHARVYMLGLQKALELDAGLLSLYAEAANLNPSISILHRATRGSIYRHARVRQGYTHRGQLLGAWTGPGSDSQLLGSDLYTSWGRVGMYGERVRYAVDTYFANEDLRLGYPLKYDVELTAGTRGSYFWRDFQIDLGAAYSHRRNRDFLTPELDEIEQGYRVDSNWNFQLGVAWRPAARAGIR